MKDILALGAGAGIPVAGVPAGMAWAAYGEDPKGFMDPTGKHKDQIIGNPFQAVV